MKQIPLSPLFSGGKWLRGREPSGGYSGGWWDAGGLAVSPAPAFAPGSCTRISELPGLHPSSDGEGAGVRGGDLD